MNGSRSNYNMDYVSAGGEALSRDRDLIWPGGIGV